MSPPCYADLGKQARDLFNKNYHFGVVKLECKSTTQTGVEFNLSGTSLNRPGKVNASLEIKCKIPEYALTLNGKYNANNTLYTEISSKKLARGLTVAFHANFAQQTCKKSGALRTTYKLENVHLNCDVDLRPPGPIAHAAALLHYQGWLAGAQVSFDTAKNRLSKTNFAFAFLARDFAVHTNVNNGQQFAGSVFMRVNPQLQAGVQLAWTAGTNATRFGLDCVYEMNQDTSVRAKVSNSGRIGLGFTHRVLPEISLALSTMVDVKNFNQGGHKLGLGLDLSP